MIHYVVIRGDLPIGVACAQLVHAAGESSNGKLREGTYAIVLSVPNEAALHVEAIRLRSLGVGIVSIHEPDAPYHGQLMALGVHPGLRSTLRKYFSNLPLYRGPMLESSKQDARKRDVGSLPASSTLRVRGSVADQQE